MEKVREFFDRNFNVYIDTYIENGKTVIKYRNTDNYHTNRNYENPFFAHIAITDLCNLKCEYCYRSNIHNNKNNCFNQEEIIKLVDMFYINNVWGITWTGGEPYLYENFAELVKYVHGLGIHQTIITNGTIVPHDVIEKGPHQNIVYQISLNDAWNKQNSMHAKVYETINRCNNEKIPNLLTVILNNVDEEEMDRFVERQIAKGVKNIRFGYFMPNKNTNKEEYLHYLKKISQNKSMYYHIRDKYRTDINIYYQFDKTEYNNSYIPRRISMCEAGTSLLYIESNGDVYPCPLFTYDSNFLCGNIRKNSLVELWDSTIIRKMREISACNSCNNNCQEWCRAINYYINGNLGGKGIACSKS